MNHTHCPFKPNIGIHFIHMPFILGSAYSDLSSINLKLHRKTISNCNLCNGMQCIKKEISRQSTWFIRFRPEFFDLKEKICHLCVSFACLLSINPQRFIYAHDRRNHTIDFALDEIIIFIRWIICFINTKNALKWTATMTTRLLARKTAQLFSDTSISDDKYIRNFTGR